MVMGRKRTKNPHWPPRFNLKHGAYYWTPRIDGRMRWIRLGTSFGEAIKQWAEHEGVKVEGNTVGDALDAYIAEDLPKLAETTQREYLRYAVQLRGVFGESPLDIVVPSDIAQYLRRSKSAPIQANRTIAMLSSVYNLAMGLGWANSNPCHGVRRNTERPRDRYIDDKELSAFLKYASELTRRYVTFKLLTGMRKSAILALTHRNFTDAGIDYAPGKRGKRRIIEWSDELRFAVDAIWDLPGRLKHRIHFFCTRGNKPYTPTGFDSIWQRDMRRALVKSPDLNERFTEHDLRAKAASDLPLQHANELLGHGELSTTKRIYRRKPETVKPAR